MAPPQADIFNIRADGRDLKAAEGSRHTGRLMTQETPPDPEAPAAQTPEAVGEEPRQSTPFLVVQFFLFPLGIVVVCVTVFLVFGLIASGPKDPRAILAEVRSGGGIFNVKRWQAAFSLASTLASEKEVARARSDPRFAEELIALYRETAQAQGDDLLVRRYLAMALGHLGDARAVPVLRETLQGGNAIDPQTRIYAAWALGAIGDPAGLPDLLQLSADEDPGMRKTAVHALGRFATPEATAVLDKALADPTADVRWNAAVGLAQRRDVRAAPVLLQMMDRSALASMPEITTDQSETVMLQGVRAAALVPAPELRAALERLRDGDPSLKVREAARAALEVRPAASSSVP
jgi:HEAT repeat protein